MIQSKSGQEEIHMNYYLQAPWRGTWELDVQFDVLHGKRCFATGCHSCFASFIVLRSSVMEGR